MNCFIIPRRPKSYNNWRPSDSKTQAYIQAIADAFLKMYPSHEKLTGDLYGTIYYFYRNVREGTRQDADNISKPVWDSLRDILFLDDRQVRLRIAGLVDLDKEMSQWKLPESITDQFIEAVDNHDHFIYVECGKLTSTMFRFNQELNEN